MLYFNNYLAYKNELVIIYKKILRKPAGISWIFQIEEIKKIEIWTILTKINKLEVLGKAIINPD